LDTTLLPENAAPPRLIVCEQTGQWAVALRRHLAPAGPRIHETRTLADCWEMLAQGPAGFVVAELTRVNGEALLDRIVRCGCECPLARVAVVADRSLADVEWLVREAGAVHFCASPRRLEPLARIARRHLRQAPRPKRAMEERILARLPWGKERDEEAAINDE
jgi:DNA-binding NtrC family response regulator